MKSSAVMSFLPSGAFNTEKIVPIVRLTSILLEPSLSDYKNYINMLNTEFKDEFGFDVNSGADEQSISYYYSLSIFPEKLISIMMVELFRFYDFP